MQKSKCQRHTDRVNFARSGSWHTGEGSLLSASDQFSVLLQMEIEIRWFECV